MTGSTHAGMIAGFAALEDADGRPRRVIGIDASATLDKTRDQVARIARHTAELIGLGRDLRDDEITVLEGWAGDLYGIPVESTLDAIRLTGQLEGMIIDPVYEGKSMAGLIDLVASARSPRTPRCSTPTSAASRRSTPTPASSTENESRHSFGSSAQPTTAGSSAQPTTAGSSAQPTTAGSSAQPTTAGSSAQPTVMASSRSLMNSDDVTGSSPDTRPIGGASGVTTASWLAS